MQLDSLQQATQFSISPRLRAATPCKASSFARYSAGRPGSAVCARANFLLASVHSPSYISNAAMSRWMSAVVDALAGSPGARPASLRFRCSIPRRPLPTTESRICASDVGSSIRVVKRMATG